MFEITEKIKCIGCGACANKCVTGCIEMIEDEKEGGFLYPSIDFDKCINCGACKKACPVNDASFKISEDNNAYACINKDEEARMKSTSGGIFYLLAREILNENGVVFGVAYTEEMDVMHKYITDIKDLHQFMGSKYVQSNVGNSYKECLEFLKSGRTVLFTGTPCQIAGLKKFLGKDYENLLCHDLICHGVPSNYAWKKYIEYLEEKNKKKVVNFKFRSKYNGWNKCGVEIWFNDGTCNYSYLNKESYTQIFLAYANLRKSCYACQFRGEVRASDITLADFWGIEKVYKEMFDDKGISLLITNTEKGEMYFGKIKKYLNFKEVDKKIALKGNASYYKSADKSLYRESLALSAPRYSWKKLLSKHGKKIIIKAKIKRTLKPAYVRLKKILNK